MRRFGEIRFNLLRAMEILEDLNHDDMDVSAPPSDREFRKETELAGKLNDYLIQLIEDGFFEDCAPREAEEESSTDQQEDSVSDSPGSEGFNYTSSQSEQSAQNASGRTASRESLTNRFRRYVRRILPGGGNRESSSEGTTGASSAGASSSSSRRRFLGIGRKVLRGRMLRPEDADIREPHHFDDVAFRHQEYQGRRDGRSNSSQESSLELSNEESQERTSSEPFDARVVYEHRHRHKHNHPGSHHHHDTSDDHVHTYHVHRRRGSGESGGESGGVEADGVANLRMESSNEGEIDEDELVPSSRSSSRSRRSSRSGRSGRSTGSRRSGGSRRGRSRGSR